MSTPKLRLEGTLVIRLPLRRPRLGDHLSEALFHPTGSFRITDVIWLHTVHATATSRPHGLTPLHFVWSEAAVADAVWSRGPGAKK